MVSNSDVPTNSELLQSEQDPVKDSSPQPPDENTPTIRISGEDHEGSAQPGTIESIATESNIVQEVTVTDLNDDEFGGFVSVTNTIPDSKPESEPSPGFSQENDATTKLDDTSSAIGDSQQSSIRHDKVVDSKIDGTAESQTDQPKKVISQDTHQRMGPEHSDGDTSIGQKQSPFRGAKDPIKQSNIISVVNRISPKSTGRDKTGKKKSKKEVAKEKSKKGHGKTEPVVDDNLSETSYQPDTDLSRSKASRKINGNLNIVSFLGVLCLSVPFSTFSRAGTLYFHDH